MTDYGEGFVMTNDVVMLFFRFCRRYGIEDKQRRIEILRKLAARKKAKYIAHPKEYIQGKRIGIVQ